MEFAIFVVDEEEFILA